MKYPLYSVLTIFRILTVVIVCLPLFSNGQGNKPPYGIKDRLAGDFKDCEQFFAVLQSLPPDFSYGTKLYGRDILVYFKYEEGFRQLFEGKYDGMAIDIIDRRQFDCDKPNAMANSSIYKGSLLPPVYKKDLLKSTYSVPGYKYFFVKMGELPAQYEPRNVELNLLMIKGQTLCEYIHPISIKGSEWGLLEMGLYRDSLPEDDNGNSSTLLSKTLRFTVPFNKNQTTYNKEDILPLYDSLNLTDYNIKQINIRAYSSVEGPLENNIALQEGRAKSIVEALQSYQSPEIKSVIVTNENWVQFMNDIKSTEYAYLLRKSKEEVKQLLSEGLMDELEPVLKQHRLAYIELQLQKKFEQAEKDPAVLRKFFDQSIKDENIAEALYIQNLAYELIKNEQLPDDFMSTLTVPKSLQYGPLLNNELVFKYELNGEYVFEGIEAYGALHKLMPDNVKVLYNLTALMIKGWTVGDMATNQTHLLNQLDNLKAMELDDRLYRRLLINYKIVLVRYIDRSMSYSRKQANLKDIYHAFKALELSDQDLLSLAMFFSQNSAFDLAKEVVEERAYEVDASEDLVFYYLTLTIYRSKMVEKDFYRTLMLNAIDKNRPRFCLLFNSQLEGGLTFQLLQDEYLKATYCETCSFNPK